MSTTAPEAADRDDVTQEPALKRVMGSKLLLLFIIGDILGAGVYAVTGQMAGLVGGIVWVPFVVAFLETVLNANPFMKRLFCFDDLPFMLWFGTLSYGICFVFALPMWLRIDDTPNARAPLGRVVVELLACTMAIVISFELLRHVVAPHVTEVQRTERHSGGCLER